MKIIGIECLEVLFSKDRDKYYFGVFPDSPLTRSVKSSIKPTKIFSLNRSKKVPFYFNDIGLIENSNFFAKEIIKESSLFLGFHPDKKLGKRLQDKKITSIANNLKFQNELENKIYFHKFLTKFKLPVPRGLIIKKADDLKKISVFPCVLQEAESYGSFGTFIIKNKASLNRFIKRKNKSYPLLYRDFIEGLPCGITLVVDKKNIILSSIRLQASVITQSGGVAFHGIQWIPTNKLNKKQISSIERSCKQLCLSLQKSGFNGVVNIDFILTKDQIYFIECNPRISGATWHLSLNESLLHGISLVSCWADICNNKLLSKSFPKLPKTTYEGSTLDFDVYDKTCKRKSNEPAGIYRLVNNKIELISTDIKDFKDNHAFFILPGAANGESVSIKSGTGVLISHRPLYIWSTSSLGANCKVTPLGSVLLDKCKRIIL